MPCYTIYSMERFLDYFIPERYKLALTLNKAKNRMVGEVIVSGEAKADTVKLHAVDMTIKAVYLNSQAADFAREDGTISVKAAPGHCEIRVEYFFDVTADMQGAYLSTYEYEGKKEQIVVTQFESHYARECFPCIDEPAAKAVFDLKLSSEDPEDTILSNMPAALTTNQDNLKTVRFDSTPRMSTYLVAFAFGKFISYESQSKHGVKITTYAGLHQSVSDLKYAGDFAADVLDFYDDRFKTPFPLPKLDLLALPDFEAGAMENWGLTTYREIALLANEDSAVDQKMYVCTVVAHELSHMWFGDLVTMKWWDDLWLNESFASLMQTYSTALLRPNLGAWDDFYSSSVISALLRDCLPGVQPVKTDVANVADIANLFDGAIVYSKGSRLLLMLMRTIGEDAFFAGLADYFEKHKYGNTTADDLWDALSGHVDFNIREFMDPWLLQPGYPVVQGDLQDRFLITNERDNTRYPIRELRDDLSGHYIIQLSEEELSKKLGYLFELNTEQKLRLLLDRKLLAKTRRVPTASLLPMLKAFSGEKEAIIWDVISTIISDIRIMFAPDTETEAQFKHYVRQLCAPNFARLGVKQREGDSENDIMLRATIMSLMGYADDEDCINLTRKEYESVQIADVDPNLRAVVGVTLLKRNDTLSKPYFKLYSTTPDAALKSDLCSALTATKSLDTGVSYLDKLRDGTIRPQDRLGFFVRLVRNHIIKEKALAWMYDNWDWLYEVEGEKTIAEYPRYTASAIRGGKEANEFRAFFEKHIHEEILTRDIKVAFSEIDARLDLIVADSNAVEVFLRNNK